MYRELPLPFHSNAQKASEAAVCAGKQGKYYDMHDAHFENNRDPSVTAIKGHAERIGLKMSKFSACVDGGEAADHVSRDSGDAQAAGINGTPGFVLGRLDKKNKTVTGTVISGALPYASFKQQIDQLLSQGG